MSRKKVGGTTGNVAAGARLETKPKFDSYELFERDLHERIRQVLADPGELSRDRLYTQSAVQMFLRLFRFYDIRVASVVLTAPFVASDNATQQRLFHAAFVALAQTRSLEKAVQLMNLLHVTDLSRVKVFTMMARDGRPEDCSTYAALMREIAPRITESIDRLHALIMVGAVSAAPEDLTRVTGGKEYRELQRDLEGDGPKSRALQVLFHLMFLFMDVSVTARGIRILERMRDEDPADAESMLWIALNGWDADRLDALAELIVGSRYHAQIQHLAQVTRDPSMPS